MLWNLEADVYTHSHTYAEVLICIEVGLDSHLMNSSSEGKSEPSAKIHSNTDQISRENYTKAVSYIKL